MLPKSDASTASTYIVILVHISAVHYVMIVATGPIEALQAPLLYCHFSSYFCRYKMIVATDPIRALPAPLL